MECLVLASPEEKRRALQWGLEDLGEAWRCHGAAEAATALHLLRTRPIRLLVLTDTGGSPALLRRLTAEPLLSPPWILGENVAAPDGSLPALTALPELLEGRRRQLQLPALCPLRLEEATHLARGMLHALGVPERLRAWAFLPDMAGLTAVHPPLLTDMSHGLYPLTAQRHGMTAAAVERSLRLCVESTWGRGELAALERFFGSSVDPERGKPTNREFLCRVQERVTLAAARIRL